MILLKRDDKMPAVMEVTKEKTEKEYNDLLEIYDELFEKYGSEAIEDARESLYRSGIPYISDEELPLYAEQLANQLNNHYNDIRMPHR